MKGAKLPGIFERPGRDGPLLYVGYKNPLTGIWDKRAVPSNSLEEAIRLRREAEARAQRGEAPFPPKEVGVGPVTVGAVIDRRLRLKDGAQQTETARKLEMRAADRLTGFMRDMAVNSVTLETLTEYRRARTAAISKNGRRATARTVKIELSFLRAALNSAREAGLIGDHVFSKMKKDALKGLLPPNEEPFQRITDDEFNSIRSNLSARYQAVIRFLLGTGMRRAEAVCLTWEQIDGRMLSATLSTTSTKGKKTRRVPLSSVAQQILGERPKGGRVFPDVNLASINSAWTRACKVAKIKRRIHDLRGEFTCRFLEAGGTVYEAMDICGWSSLEVVLKYLKASNVRVRDVLERMSKPADGGALVEFPLPSQLPNIRAN